jgi:hypothetical protein
MIRKDFVLWVAICLITAPVHAVEVTTIDFESVPGVTPVNGFLNDTPVPPASRLNTQLLATHGVRFRSEAPHPDYVALIGLGGGHATSGSNGIGGVNIFNDIRYGVPTIISFFDPMSPSVAAVTDFVSIRGDLFDDGGPLSLEAFDFHGNLLATDSAVDVGGPLLSVQVPGIHMVRLIDVGSTVGWDDLTFSTLRVVPEPATWLLAFIAPAVVVRRRRIR